MQNEPFEKQDREWMEKLEGVRDDRRVPEGLLTGFSSAVFAKIKERQTEAAGTRKIRAVRWRLPVWASVAAVIVIAVGLVSRAPETTAPEVASGGRVVLLAQAELADLSEEIAALREIGAWTEEDETEFGFSEEEEAWLLTSAPGSRESALG